MPINSFEIIWQNFLTIAVVFTVFALLFKNLKNKKIRDFISENIEKMKIKEGEK